MARVLPVTRRFLDGDHQIVPFGEPRRTDDRGEYRLYGLPPASYSVAVFPGPNSDSGIFSPVYYPGPGPIALFELRAGEEKLSINITIPQQGTASLSGTVSAIPPEAGPQRVALSLVSSGGLQVPLSTLWADNDGAFSVETLSAGEYTVFAWLPLPQPGPLTSGGPSAYWARGTTTISGAQGLIHLTLNPGISVRGALSFDGVTGTEHGCRGASALSVRSRDGWPDTWTADLTENQGQFVLHGLPSGRFRIELPHLERRCRVSGVVVNGNSFRAGDVALDSAADITVNVTSAVGEVTGTVSGLAGKPDTASVVLISKDDPNWFEVVPVSRSGQYRFRDVPVGAYLVMVAGQVTSLNTYDVRTALLHGAHAISLETGSTVTVNFTIE